MNYNNYRRQTENNFNILQDARQEFRINKASSQVDSLMNRVIVAEDMVQAMWNILSRMGATREELFTELNKVIEKQKNIHEKRPKYTCPKCGKIMQNGNMDPFTCNCMYCGSLRTINPYDTIEDLEAAGEEGFLKETPVEKNPLDDLGF